jgi:Big-like domain-containing protein/peptidase M28-like protein
MASVIHPVRFAILGFFVWVVTICPLVLAQQSTLLTANFDNGADGFIYQSDAFGTNQPVYSSGAWGASAGFGGTGGLQVSLGGVDANLINDMSGGWSITLNLPADETGVTLSFRYKLDQSATYGYDGYTHMLVMVDGVQYGRGSKNYVDHIGGDGSSTEGNSNTYLPTTDWQQHSVFLGNLAAGAHTIVLGGYNNKKAVADQSSMVTIDDVLVTSGNPTPAMTDQQTMVNRLDRSQFVNYLQGLTSFGDRCRMSSCPGSPANSFFNAQAWVASQLTAMGYTVQYHTSTLNGGVSNLYVTKVGVVNPTQMYIVSAHLDGRGGGAAYDDDGSGSALVLTVAQAFAAADVEIDKSVRFIWWDKEESGLYGSGAYVQERQPLQGTADEPTWLGVIQHDMILYDHGAGTPSASQSPYADLDVEWRAGTAAESQSRLLALKWSFLSGTYATQYPATAYNFSTNTDDTSFQPYTASVSVRENRRSLTSGTNAEWINPNYHTTADVASSYSDLDLDLGFNAVQSTTGMVAELVNAHLVASSTVTTTTVTSSPNPSVFSQAVTFTATVTSSGGVPVGTVTFTEGSTVLASNVAVDGSGHAAFSTASLAVGSHTITASFTGSGTWRNSSGSDSGSPQVVNKDGTTSSVTSSLNPSNRGQSVTFTATVVASAPGTAVPTGSVTFKDGTKNLGSKTLDASGHATFSTSTLSRGSHSITVVYGGSSNFLGSTSPVFTQTVN